MTAPTTDPVATATPEVDLNDDALLAAAIGGRVARNQHILPDDPAPEPALPSGVPAPEPPSATVATPADQPTAATPAPDSTTPAPEASATADPSAPDPFMALAKDAAPLGYKQSGQPKTFDGILEVPGRGAIIPADKLEEVRNFIARGQSNADAVRDLMPQVQQYEAMGGVQRFHELEERNAQLNASALLILNTVFQNPRQFVNDDGSPNTVALDMLKREARVAAQEARFTAITERTAQQQTFQTSARDAETRQTAVPQYLAQHHTDLHPDDRAFVERKGAQYLFAVTAEQAPHYGVPAGTLMIDLDSLGADVTHLKSLRTQAATTHAASAAAVKAAERAAQENARRNVAPPPKPAPPPAARPRDRDTGQFTRLDAAEIFDRSLRGDPIGTPHLTE